MGRGRRKFAPRLVDGIRLPEGFTGLLITTPTYVGFSNVYVHSLAPTVAMLTKLGIPNVIVTLPGEAVIATARDALLAFFMASRHSHMLCVDSDVSWQKEDVLRLLLCSHEFVMGVYPRKTLPPPGQPMSYPIHWKIPGEDGRFETCPRCGSVEIEGGPAGFMMIRRSVGEKLAAAYPELKYKAEGKTPEIDAHTYAFYLEMLDGGFKWAEDLSFCKRWRAIGGRVWLDPTIKLNHQGQYLYQGDVAELMVRAPRKEGIA